MCKLSFYYTQTMLSEKKKLVDIKSISRRKTQEKTLTFPLSKISTTVPKTRVRHIYKPLYCSQTVHRKYKECLCS